MPLNQNRLITGIPALNYSDRLGKMLKHRYLNQVKRAGLFRNVYSFSEIEKQIEEHSDSNKDRGDAFEVFAEAYLTLSINLPYKSVYPGMT